MTALLEYLDLTVLLEYIDLLNRYSGGPFQAGARGKMPQLPPPPVGGPVHKQTGSNDCGLFSIAYAVLLCLGENSGTLVFDYPKMCSHLSSCIEQQCFSLLPIRGKRKKI